jgi:iron complex outermembrane receptor protein
MVFKAHSNLKIIPESSHSVAVAFRFRYIWLTPSSNRLLMASAKRSILLCFAACCFTVSTAWAQLAIEGKINDDLTGEPLIGANVVIMGTTTGTTTDIDGKFELNVAQLPVTLTVSYLGYLNKDITVSQVEKNLTIRMEQDKVLLEAVEVVDSRITEKQKESPVTIESMDLIGVKETPAANFYDGLGALKGVDLTSASMGFKVVNTRGFNSTRPVRSLQLVDGVDNQAPGLNFSIGNFAGASELDIQRVELIVGANSALYGPNAFNGVISMETKDPFVHKGISAMGKVGERNLRETALRYANAHKLFGEKENFAYKLNIAYMEADDWEANSLNPTEQSIAGISNSGGYDAVNVYGDENIRPGINDFTGTAGRLRRPGLGIIHRTGYNEADLVDYDAKNLKISPSLHFKLTNKVTLKYTYNYGSGTTVYQGDNRYSLKDLQIQQHVGEIFQKDKFFIRAYHTKEDAGQSYDAVFTALLLQQAAKPNEDWSEDYENYWVRNVVNRVNTLPGYPNPNDPKYTNLWFGSTRDSIYRVADAVLKQYKDSLDFWHLQARQYADGPGGSARNSAFLRPGTDAFDSTMKSITSKNTFLEGGSGFFDQSSLTHYQGQYKFGEKEHHIQYLSVLLGANYRKYQPSSNGTIFIDTGDTKISNSEYGFYSSIEQRMAKEKLILTLTARLDKNENFDYLVSPAASAVYLHNKNMTFRSSFSSAIRNPTLQDQYLYYNVGRAILIGNLNGFDSLVTVPSFFNAYEGTFFEQDSLVYFDVDPVRPEKVQSLEIGFKGVLLKNLFLDASYYFSWYTDFLGYKVGADINLDTALNLATINEIYRVSANSPDQVTTQGINIGLTYYFKKYYSLLGNYSFNQLDRQGSTDPIIPAFNTPKNKFNLGISGRDILGKIAGMRIKNVGFNVNYKWVQGFLFEGSPQFTGSIPDYDMIDAQVNYRVPKIHSTFKLGASNLLNKQNYQTYGGPQIGRLTYFSILYELQKS